MYVYILALPDIFLKDESVIYSCINGFRETITKGRGYTPHGRSAATGECPSPYYIDKYLREHGSPSNSASRSDSTSTMENIQFKKTKHQYSKYALFYYLFPSLLTLSSLLKLLYVFFSLSYIRKI